MSNKLVVVYYATSLGDAHLMQDALARAGMDAIIVDPIGAAGEEHDARGVTRVRVAVAEADADDADEVVRFFLQRRQQRLDEEGLEDPHDVATGWPAEEWAAWPACPACGQPRMAICPCCQTIGCDFPPADFQEPSSADGTASDEPAEVLERSVPLALLCTTCLEPFDSGLLRHCEECGHDFGEGVELPAASDEQLSPWGWVILTGSIAVTAAVAAYLAYALRGTLELPGR